MAPPAHPRGARVSPPTFHEGTTAANAGNGRPLLGGGGTNASRSFVPTATTTSAGLHLGGVGGSGLGLSYGGGSSDFGELKAMADKMFKTTKEKDEELKKHARLAAKAVAENEQLKLRLKQETDARNRAEAGVSASRAQLVQLERAAQDLKAEQLNIAGAYSDFTTSIEKLEAERKALEAAFESRLGDLSTVQREAVQRSSAVAVAASERAGRAEQEAAEAKRAAEDAVASESAARLERDSALADAESLRSRLSESNERLELAVGLLQKAQRDHVDAVKARDEAVVAAEQVAAEKRALAAQNDAQIARLRSEEAAKARDAVAEAKREADARASALERDLASARDAAAGATAAAEDAQRALAEERERAASLVEQLASSRRDAEAAAEKAAEEAAKADTEHRLQLQLGVTEATRLRGLVESGTEREKNLARLVAEKDKLCASLAAEKDKLTHLLAQKDKLLKTISVAAASDGGGAAGAGSGSGDGVTPTAVAATPDDDDEFALRSDDDDARFAPPVKAKKAEGVGGVRKNATAANKPSSKRPGLPFAPSSRRPTPSSDGAPRRFVATYSKAKKAAAAGRGGGSCASEANKENDNGVVGDLFGPLFGMLS